MAEQHIKDWQWRIGVNADGDFGPATLGKSEELADKAGVPAPPVFVPSPGKFSLGAGSLDKLHTVEPELAAVVRRAILLTPVDFTVLEGIRSRERQAQLVNSGASRTMNSRHLTGHAVDLGAWVGGKIAWDWPLYDKIAVAMKTAAKELRYPLTWGGDWASFRDGPHFQRTWGK